MKAKTDTPGPGEVARQCRKIGWFLGIDIAPLCPSVNTCAAVPVPIGYVDVNVSGGQSKATAYAQQMLEQLKNQTFNPGLLNQTDTPEPGYTRTWTIAQEPGTNPPNRLARIQVTVVWTRGDRSQTVTLETMRAE